MILYKIDDVSNRLGVSTSTIKKYYLMIEEKGYRFKRGTAGNLMFDDSDIDMFKMLIVVKNQPGITLKEAVDKVVSNVRSVGFPRSEWEESPQENIDTKRLEKVVVEAMGLIQTYREELQRKDNLIESQQAQLKEYSKYIESAQSLIEQKEKETSRSSSEILSSLESIHEQIEEVKKKKWWQMW